MECNEFKSLLLQTTEIENSADAQQHLAECKNCRLEFKYQSKINEFINQRKNIEINDNFSQQIIQRIQNQKRFAPKTSTQIKHKQFAAAVAAIVFSVVLGIYAGKFTANTMNSKAYSDYENLSSELSYGFYENSFDLTNLE